MRLAWLSLAAILVARAPAFADGEAPPPTPPAEPTAPPPAEPPAPPQAETPLAPPSNPDFYVPHNIRGPDIVVNTPRERSTNNIAVVAALAVGGAVIGGLGVYFNLDAKSAVDELSTNTMTNTPWTPDKQDKYDHAHNAGIEAGICYGIGGALVIAAVATLIATDPGSETTIIHPHGNPGTPVVTPTSGGAMLGGAWRF